MDPPILRLDQQTLPEPHILPAVPKISLEILRGRVKQRLRAIQGRVFLIGSASDCDLVLGDLQFPEAYAYIFVSGTDVSIRRLGTGPELLVCGEVVESSDLFHGDLIEMGPFELRIVIDHPPRRHRHGSEGDAAASDRQKAAEQTAAIEEVRTLLTDVRRALATSSRPTSTITRRTEASRHNAPLRAFTRSIAGRGSPDPARRAVA